MKTILFMLCLLFAGASFAQYETGYSSMDFTDPSRTRTISCEMYYPSVIAGQDVNCAAGTFPVIVFGHGFMMDYDAYLNFADMLVPLGYVLIFPTTETGMSPDHEAFGLDLKFLNEEIQSQAVSNSSFLLYNHFNGKTAIAGHSMGGGASFLAAAGNNNLTTLINFAAAETDPSAVAAAASVSVPSVVFVGENDGVAPPDDHQIPMYNALGATCKYSITIVGGGHCYFANSNTICSTGEMFTSPQPTITREEQHDVVFDLLVPYLEWQLKDNNSLKSLFEDSLLNSARITALFSCPETGIQNPEEDWNLSPNPVTGQLNITFTKNGVRTITISDLSGRIMLYTSTSNEEEILNLERLPDGLYFLHINEGNQLYSIRLLLSN